MALFTVDLIADTSMFGLDPSEQVMKKILLQLMELWVDTTNKFKLYLGDSIFDQFLRYNENAPTKNYNT